MRPGPEPLCSLPECHQANLVLLRSCERQIGQGVGTEDRIASETPLTVLFKFWLSNSALAPDQRQGREDQAVLGASSWVAWHQTEGLNGHPTGMVCEQKCHKK